MIKLIFSIVTLLTGVYSYHDFQDSIVMHEITIDHPGFLPADDRNFILYEKLDVDKHPIHYYMNVESTICLEGVCKIVPVRLYWNPLGQYIEYELDKGVTLEKTEGRPFLEEDYVILHDLLKDPQSAYRDIRYDQITKEKVVGENQIDAISGATSIILAKGQTVVGAAWTCFTLWHWAHGPVVQVIRGLTGTSLTSVQLKKLLKGSDDDIIFALEELMRRGGEPMEYIDQMTYLLNSYNSEVLRLIIQYLEQSSGSSYCEPMRLLLNAANGKQRISLLTSILKSTSALDEPFLNDLTELMIHTNEYQEINMCFLVYQKLESTHHPDFDRIAELLNRPILIARRAYWYLSEKQLSPDLKQKLDRFELENRESLY